MTEPWRGEVDPAAAEAEQRAELDQQRRAAIAEGELHYPSLPRFNPKRRCAKCGSREKRITFCHEGASGCLTPRVLRHIGGNQAIVVVCQSCGDMSFTKPLDVKA